jgi:predicted glycosyl hydrolase (DUF1957 family)
MDLGNLDFSKQAEEGAWLHLEHPTTGDPLETEGSPVRVLLLGRDSAAYRKAAHKAQDARLKAAARGAAGARGLTAEVLERESIRVLAACVVDWEGIVVDGEALEYSHAAAVELLERFDWIKQQVDAFVEDRANFLGESERS